MASFNQLGFAGALALTGCMFQVPGLGPTDGATDIVNDADGGQDLTVADILSNPDLQMDLNGDAAPPSPDLAIDGAVVPDLTNIKKTDLAVVPDGTLSLDGLTPADFATPPDLFVPDLIQPDGTVIIPSPTVIHPSTSSIDLPATWAYLFWKDNSGKSVSQYQLCSTSGPMSGITGDANCPNPISVAKNYTVFNALTSGQTVYWKLRGMYSDGSLSSYTPVQTIQINPLLAGWWKMNGNVNDLSGGGNNGVLQNAPGFTNGVEGQAIQLNRSE